MSEAEELIQQIKQQAADLQLFKDNLALDKYLAELDYLIYRLRTVAISPTKKEYMTSINEALREILG